MNEVCKHTRQVNSFLDSFQHYLYVNQIMAMLNLHITFHKNDRYMCFQLFVVVLLKILNCLLSIRANFLCGFNNPHGVKSSIAQVDKDVGDSCEVVVRAVPRTVDPEVLHGLHVAVQLLQLFVLVVCDGEGIGVAAGGHLVHDGQHGADQATLALLVVMEQLLGPKCTVYSICYYKQYFWAFFRHLIRPFLLPFLFLFGFSRLHSSFKADPEKNNLSNYFLSVPLSIQYSIYRYIGIPHFYSTFRLIFFKSVLWSILMKNLL